MWRYDTRISILLGHKYHIHFVILSRFIDFYVPLLLVIAHRDVNFFAVWHFLCHSTDALHFWLIFGGLFYWTKLIDKWALNAWHNCVKKQLLMKNEWFCIEIIFLNGFKKASVFNKISMIFLCGLRKKIKIGTADPLQKKL